MKLEKNRVKLEKIIVWIQVHRAAGPGSLTFREEPKNAVDLEFRRHIDYSRPSYLGFCLISLISFHVVNFFR